MPVGLGLQVHYSRAGAGAGLALPGSPTTSYGGYLSTTAIPSGSTISGLFPGFRRFNRAGDYADRRLWRCLFVVNNTGAEINPTLAVDGPAIIPEFGSVLNDLTIRIVSGWDATAASPWASASAQAGTFQVGPVTAAQVLGGTDAPSTAGGSPAPIPQGYCRAFWVVQIVGSGRFPGFAGYESISGSITLTITT